MPRAKDGLGIGRARDRSSVFGTDQAPTYLVGRPGRCTSYIIMRMRRNYVYTRHEIT